MTVEQIKAEMINDAMAHHPPPKSYFENMGFHTLLSWVSPIYRNDYVRKINLCR